MIKKILPFILLLAYLSAFAAGPKQISYQGILTDALGQPKADGAYEMTFKLYNVASEGNNIWSETKTVQLKNGVFTTILGSDSALALPFDTTYYLGVSLGTGGEYAPRVQLTSSGYAIRAIVSDSALSAYSSVVSGSANSATISDSARAASIADSSVHTYKAIVSDSATFAITASTIPSTAIAAGSIDSTKLAAGSVGSSEIADGAIVTADVDSTFKAPDAVKSDYATTAGSVAGTSISGTIITSVIKAVDSTGLSLVNDSGNGLLVDSDGNIVIGDSSNITTLELNGALKVVSSGSNMATLWASAKDSGAAGFYFDASDGDLAGLDYGSLLQTDSLDIELNNRGPHKIRMYTNNEERFTIDEKGNVGIGTTKAGAPLHIYRKADAHIKVESDTSHYAYLYLNTAVGGNAFLIKNDTGTANGMKEKSLYLWNSKGPVQFAADGKISTTIDTLGNVGIGTTNPSSKLFVQGDASNDTLPWVTFSGGGNVGSNVSLRLYDRGTAGTNENIMQFAHGGVSGPAIAARIRTRNFASNTSTGGNMYLETFSDNAKTVNSNQLVLANTGNVGIGTSSPSSSLHALGAGNTSIRSERSGNTYIDLRAGATSYGSGLFTENKMCFATSDWANPDMIIGTGGNVTMKGNLTVEGTFSNPSDIRYKKNIYPIENAIEKLKKLGGFYYDWKRNEFPKKKFSGRRQVGVIAQDVEKVLPEVVQTDEKGYKSVSYGKLTALLIEAVKSQQEQIEEQQKVLDKVENTVEMVKNLLNENTLLRKQIASLKEKVDPELKVNLHYDLEENNNEKK